MDTKTAAVVVDTYSARKRLEARRDRINARIAELVKEREQVAAELAAVGR